MKRHPSDRHIQRQLEHHPTPVNAEELWANIESVVQPEDKSRRRWFFWLFLAGLILGGGWYLITPLSPQQSTKTDAIIADNPETEAAAAMIAPSAQTEQKSPSTENDQNYDQATNKQTTATTSKNLTTTQAATASVSASTNASIIEKTTNNPGAINAAVTRQSNESTTLPSATTTDSPSAKENAAAPTSFSKMPLIDLLPGNSYNLLTSPNRINNLGELTPRPPLNMLSSYSPWSVTFRVGLGSTLQDLSDKTDSFPDYQSRRKVSEQQLETYSAEIGVQWSSQQRWYLRGGLGYRQTVERFSFSDNTSETVEDSAIVRIVIAPNGDTTDIIRDRVTGTRTVIYDKTTYNRHRFLELPLIAGYQFGDGPFSFGLEAGLVPQLLLSVKGEILDPAGSITDLSTVSESSFSLGVHGAFNINYAFASQWEVQFSPVFRYQFGNLHTNDYPLEVAYHSLGLQLGLRYAW